MSTQSFATRPPVSATDLHAAAWIERRDCTTWNETDEAALKAWLQESPAHHVAFLRLNAGWHRAERLAALTQSRRDRGLRAWLPNLSRIAAALAVMAVLGGGMAYYISQPAATTTYQTTIGGRQILALDDGSRIEMNTNTLIRVSTKAGQRKVWLDHGEAYFHIAHDHKRPFIVVAGAHTITDLGTTFLVRNTQNETHAQAELSQTQFKVALIEGLARVDTVQNPARPQSAMLHPGDVATLKDDTLNVEKRSLENLARDLGWRRGVITFDKTTLAEAVAEFNRYNHEKLRITDPAIENLTIGGTFQSDGLRDFASLTEAVLSLKIKHQKNEILLSR